MATRGPDVPRPQEGVSGGGGGDTGWAGSSMVGQDLAIAAWCGRWVPANGPAAAGGAHTHRLSEAGGCVLPPPRGAERVCPPDVVHLEPREVPAAAGQHQHGGEGGGCRRRITVWEAARCGKLGARQGTEYPPGDWGHEAGARGGGMEPWRGSGPRAVGKLWAVGCGQGFSPPWDKDTNGSWTWGQPMEAGSCGARPWLTWRFRGGREVQGSQAPGLWQQIAVCLHSNAQVAMMTTVCWHASMLAMRLIPYNSCPGCPPGIISTR